MIIDGKSMAKQIREELKSEVSKLKEQGIYPGLAVIVAGDDVASRVYVNNKKKACEDVGIYSREYALSGDVTESEILQIISSLNEDKNIHGILAQLPLPPQIDPLKVAEAILPEKDVDCFNKYNLGGIFYGKTIALPCTPSGIVEMMKRSNIPMDGKSCTIIGRSNIVGKPLALMMLKENASVTVCHSRTKDLKDLCIGADILICAVGKEKIVTEDMVKDGAAVIDVGMNKSQSGKLVGDVDFENVSKKAKFITPVPGGVGPMTVAMLMKNIVEISKYLSKKI